jgi:UDP-GlcNAc:undecaprenyl-phosphate GlcNAc-1-phosphate transferase
MQEFVISLLVCVILILLLRRVALRIGMLDHPGGRKCHHQPTPTVGGLAMFDAVLIAIFISNQLHGVVAILLGCGAAMVLLGVFDDRHNLSVSLRMLIQVFLVTAVIMGADGSVTYLGSGTGIFIPLGIFAIPFSVVAYVGGINAINMIDGADGMAGKMALITMLGVATICYIAGADELLPLSLALSGALIGFLLLNSRLFVKRAWIFMGDAGSMWLGLMLGWFMAQMTKGSVSAEPELVLWLFGIPLMDILVVMTRRMGRKRSPFDADRTHIHHVLEHTGLSVRLSVLIMALAQTMMVATAILFYVFGTPAWLVFWSFVLLLGVYYYWLRDAVEPDPDPEISGRDAV